MTVVVFIREEPSIAEDAFIGYRNSDRGGSVEGHADPFTSVDVLAFFVAFPGSFADGDATERALEDLLKFLGWD